MPGGRPLGLAADTRITEKVKKEAGKTKKLIEEELNTSFQILEEDSKKTFARLDKAQQEYNNLEQYTRKKKIRQRTLQ